MDDKTMPKVSMWLAEPLSTEVKESLRRLSSAEDSLQIAVMPDVHVSGKVCNGIVLATRELIYPDCVGGDIGCGMTAIAFDLDASAIDDDVTAARVLSQFYSCIPVNKHARREFTSTFEDFRLSMPLLETMKRRDGRVQLGTLGRGNHFVELQSDLDGRLWLMVHSGSRGMGQAIRAAHVANAQRSDSELLALDASMMPGQDYLNDMDWAVRYAAENRREIVRVVEAILRELFGVSADWSTLVDGSHNHVRLEIHAGQKLWVHRKGALSAKSGEAGVIPGSMGTRSFHVIGRGHEPSLCSSSHGAGRLRARHLTTKAVSIRQLEREMAGVRFDHRRANALRDEAPSAYKDISRVMRSQQELTRIVRELKPVLVYKGT